MRGISSEVLSILFFAAVVLGQLFLQQYRKRQAARRPSPVVEPDDETVVEEGNDHEDVWSGEAPVSLPMEPVRHTRTYVPSERPQDHAVPRTARRHSRRALFGSRHRVQDAVVVAAILGRCRAFEPHDPGR